MRVLIAEDETVSRLKLSAVLRKRGFDVTEVGDGEAAWQALQAPEPPPLAVLDWMMPGVEGVELCRRVRAAPALRLLYVILLTSRGEKAHIVEGLRAGANDYVTKPFDAEELQARLNVGVQVVTLQQELARRVGELEEALGRVNQLQGLLPICSYCKKIRDDHDYWHQVESYVTEHTRARFSHGICPGCFEDVVKPQIAALHNEQK
jgi:phosphoserine phosphatase RsbU/P